MASTDWTRPERPPLATATDPPQGEGLFGPAGIWHGYRKGMRQTLCGQALQLLYPWPAMVWPDGAQAGAACYMCELVVVHRA